MGIAPISGDLIENTIQTYEKKNAFGSSCDFKEKKARTIKSLCKIWSKENLKITDDEWDQLDITNFKQTGQQSNIIFMTFSNPDDVSKLTSRANNIPKEYSDNPPCLVPFIPLEAKRKI